MKRHRLIVPAILVVAGLLTAWLLVAAPPSIDQAEPTGEELVRGPHRGRLLVEGNFAIELTIYETGIPPEFHVYAYERDKPLPPETIQLTIELSRLDGQIDLFHFTPQAGYLRGSGPVMEPHSFDLTVAAAYQGRDYRWTVASYEGRTQIPDAIAKEAGIVSERAGAVRLDETLALTGRVHTDPNRLSRVRPRFPGVVQSVRRNLGDMVRAGDVLATIQSNESLQIYTVTAPIGGLIVQRDTQIGEPTADAPIFVIADLSHVWVELDVFGRDLARVRPGQAVGVETFDGKVLKGAITWISPLASHASQSVRARVPLPNPERELRPGQFVRGRVTVETRQVPLAVRQSALQRFRDVDVVFARYGDRYEVRMLTLGRRNLEWAEVLGGLSPGTDYVTKNSYLLKADIEKSGAAHDH